MTTHKEASPLAGKTVKVQLTNIGPVGTVYDYEVEDWWDHLTGGSWRWADGNPACLQYAVRAGLSFIPADDEVLYGHINGFGYLVHQSEVVDA